MRLRRNGAIWVLIIGVAVAAIAIVTATRWNRPVNGGVIAGPLSRALAKADVRTNLRAQVPVPRLEGGTIVLAAPYRTAAEAERAFGLASRDAELLADLSNGREAVLVVLLDRQRRLREYDWVSSPSHVVGGMEQAYEGQSIELSLDETGNRAIRMLLRSVEAESAGGRVKTERELDLEVIENSVKHGDQVDQPRPIEHFAYFPGESGADKFADWAKDAGFQVDEVAAREGGKWLVRFSKMAPLEIEEIEVQRVAATGASAKFGGTYDGWETGLVRKRK